MSVRYKQGGRKSGVAVKRGSTVCSATKKIDEYSGVGTVAAVAILAATLFRLQISGYNLLSGNEAKHKQLRQSHAVTYVHVRIIMKSRSTLYNILVVR